MMIIAIFVLFSVWFDAPIDRRCAEQCRDDGMVFVAAWIDTDAASETLICMCEEP